MSNRSVLPNIPHRFPMLMVDRITDYKENEWIKGIKIVSANDRLRVSSFPILLCEALAQLSKILEVVSSDAKMSGETISYLTNMQIEFYDRTLAGDEVQLTATCSKKFRDMVCYCIEAQAGEKTVLSGTLFRKIKL